MMTVQIAPGARVLFIGDSITDCGRDRIDGTDLGHGYPLLAAAQFTARRPESGVTFLNRGIGGDQVRDLRGRWRPDCLDLTPDVVTVMIGINDTWRRFDSGVVTSTEDYERDYRDVLQRTRQELAAQLVLIEPFLLPVSPDQHGWRTDLDPRIGVVRRLAAEFGATLIAADGLMAQAAAAADPRVWTLDGVHPTPAGHALLAGAWLDVMD